MQTSNPQEQHLQSSERPYRPRLPLVLRALISFLVILGITIGLSYALVPYGTTTDIILHDFYEDEDLEFDTLILGSSFAMDVNPVILDQQLGSKTYSLATFSQPFESEISLIQLAQSKQEVKRVVLAFSYETLTTETWEYTAISLMQNRLAHEPVSSWPNIIGTFLSTGQYFSNGISLGAFVPWEYNQVDTEEVSLRTAAITNINRRLEYSNPFDAGKAMGDPGAYFGQGHYRYNGNIDIDESDFLTPTDYESQTPFLQNNLEHLQQIIQYCTNNDIDLYLVGIPRRDFELIYRSNYTDTMSQIQILANQYSIPFFDYAMAKPVFYSAPIIEFFDREHLNFAGIEKFTTSLGMLIKEVSQGANYEQNFYSYDEIDQRINDIEGIDLVALELEASDNIINIEAIPYANPAAEIEYAFYVREPEQEWRLIREYNTDPKTQYEAGPTEKALEVKVFARVIGSDAEYDRYHQSEIRVY